MYREQKTMADGSVIIAKIEANDYFSATCNIYEPTTETDHEQFDLKQIDGKTYEHASGGAISEEIAEHFPHLKMFVDLHLSNLIGEPLHAIGNGTYHMKNSDKQTVIEYLRINESEYEQLAKEYSETESKPLFAQKIGSLGIQKRWKSEAETALKKLEELTK